VVVLNSLAMLGLHPPLAAVFAVKFIAGEQFMAVKGQREQPTDPEPPNLPVALDGGIDVMNDLPKPI